MDALDTEDAIVEVQTPPCFHCHQEGFVEMPLTAFRRWQAGEHIQNVVPWMPADQREQLISGTHPACWDAMFAEGD